MATRKNGKHAIAKRRGKDGREIEKGGRPWGRAYYLTLMRALIIKGEKTEHGNRGYWNWRIN